MKIALLGAGHIGVTIARLLQNSGDYQVTVADRDAAALASLTDTAVKTVTLDVANRAALTDFARGHDAVVNALPFSLAIEAAHAAAAAGAHYFDLTEDVQATQTIRALARDAKTAFMPQCGLAPGFIGIAAHSLARRFDVVHDIKMRVGALPQFPTNALKYNLTWSVDGLINEYRHPCEAIRDGVLTQAAPMEGLEHFSLDGIEYEAFNTSGGLGTLCETLAGSVRTLDYKSVRYPGHCALMRFLLDDMKLAQKPEALKALLRDAVPATEQDIVLVFVAVNGMRNGRYLEQIFTRKIAAQPFQGVSDAGNAEGQTMSAIQITTAAGICAAVDLFRQKRLPQSGFIAQEQVALDVFLANRFGAAYDLANEGAGAATSIGVGSQVTFRPPALSAGTPASAATTIPCAA
ncbi:saccharopine dehydrogenase NADP-binding domain-containing protein [Robbsia sp. KACC 23696]|uniref:saccharopine dehydrogenase family protein n=1 Tax=Robbsia sp. KACC 23696 TaxID=3149231 RepID=UPI00325A7115